MQIPLRAFNMVGLPALRALLDDRASAALTRAVSPLVDAVAAAPVVAHRRDRAARPRARDGDGQRRRRKDDDRRGDRRRARVARPPRPSEHHRSGGPHRRDARGRAREPDDQPHRSRRRDEGVRGPRDGDSRGANLDEAGRALLAEDLRSPCYEEVAVFAAFSRIVSQARSSFVDPRHRADRAHAAPPRTPRAPITARWSASSPDAKHASGRIVTPLMRLRDPQYTKILLVTLAETTPVSEAARLQADLRRAQIEPFAWVINSSLAAAGSTDPCLKQRVAAELEQIDVGTRAARSPDRDRPMDDGGAGRPRSPARPGAPPGSLRQRGCAGHDLTLRPGPGIREAWPLPGRGGSAPRPGEGGVRSAARDPARLGRGQRVTSAGLLDEASDTVGVHPAVTSSGSSRIGVASEAETRHARSLFCSTQSTRSRSVPAGTVSRGRSTISVKRVTPS